MVQSMIYFLSSDQSNLTVDWNMDDQALELPAYQYERASHNGKQAHNQAKPVKIQAEECIQPIQNEPDG